MYKYLLAMRYLYKRPVSLIAVAAIALCVFIVVVVMTVMNGLVEQFREKNHNFVGDCVVQSASLTGLPWYEEFIEKLEGLEVVDSTSAVINSFGLMTQSGYDRSIGIQIKGIDPESYAKVTSFGQAVHYHKDNIAEVFQPPYNPDAPGCVIGIDMMPSGRDARGNYYHPPTPSMYKLSVSCFPITPKGALAGGMDPVSSKTFYYSDDSNTGLVEPDASLVYIPIEYARKLTGMDITLDRISAIHIRFKDGAALEPAVGKVRQLWSQFARGKSGEQYAFLLDNVTVQSWKQNRRSIIAAMEKEQLMLSLLFAMLGLITVFIVYVVFFMIVNNKSKDIGILKSLGTADSSIAAIYLNFSILLGGLGAVFGTAGGIAFVLRVNDIENWLFENYGWQLWDRSIYAIGQIPNQPRFEVTAIIFAAAILVSLAGATIPSLQISKKKPVDILQVNQV